MAPVSKGVASVTFRSPDSYSVIARQANQRAIATLRRNHKGPKFTKEAVATDETQMKHGFKGRNAWRALLPTVHVQEHIDRGSQPERDYYEGGKNGYVTPERGENQQDWRAVSPGQHQQGWGNRRGNY